MSIRVITYDQVGDLIESRLIPADFSDLVCPYLPMKLPARRHCWSLMTRYLPQRPGLPAAPLADLASGKDAPTLLLQEVLDPPGIKPILLRALSQTTLAQDNSIAT